ncbi:homoserine kinase type II [Pseudoscourfieldia marina]
MKEHLSVGALSSSEVRRLVWEFSVDTSLLASADRAHGGYSGTNYVVTTAPAPSDSSTSDSNLSSSSSPSPSSSSLFFLKVANNQAPAELQYQVAAILHLARHGINTCTPIRLRNKTGFVSISLAKNRPAILLTHLPGRNADALIEENKVKATDVCRQAAAALAEVHELPPLAVGANMRSFLTGGCCNVADVASGRTARKFLNAGERNRKIKNHPYLRFFAAKVKELQLALRDAKTAELPQGLLHGDPFLDNVLFDEKTKKIVAWVDWEDACIGYKLWDVACGLIGCCYDTGKKEINKQSVDAFLRGYQIVRPLTRDETHLLGPFLRGALLCNATWRFEAFNILYTGTSATDSYVELMDRYKLLEKGGTDSWIERRAKAMRPGWASWRSPSAVKAAPPVPLYDDEEVASPTRRLKFKQESKQGGSFLSTLVLAAAAVGGVAFHKRDKLRRAPPPPPPKPWYQLFG